MLTVPPSTGCGPSDWREWWRIESARSGTDWKSMLAEANAALSRLRAEHIARSSS